MEIQKPEIEKKIEAEFEKWYSLEDDTRPTYNGYDEVPYFSKSDMSLAFKAAALPLYKEIQELRTGLEYYADKGNWHFEIDGREEGEHARKILSGIKL